MHPCFVRWAMAMLWVGLGGFLGAVSRYKLSGWVLNSIDGKFPWGTFVVNISGCLAAGILAGLSERYDLFSPHIRLFLFTGILGGFTTFSAFGLETVTLLQRQEFALAAFNIGASVALGLGALWLGWKVIPG